MSIAFDADAEAAGVCAGCAAAAGVDKASKPCALAAGVAPIAEEVFIGVIWGVERIDA